MKRNSATPNSNTAYRGMLLRRREEVVAGLGVKFDTLAGMGRVAEDDQAQISHDEFVCLHMNSLDYGQLRLVNEALDRIDSGEYGICMSCEEPIPPKRLNAIPWARYCVRCQENNGTQADWEQEAVVT